MVLGVAVIDLGRATDIVYDESGRIASLAGANNHTYTYDDAGQLLEAVQDEGTYAYSYGPRGEIISISDPDRSRSFTHNANVEIDAIVDDAGNAGGVEYDAAGRMVEHRDPNGEVTSYSYGARGLLVETSVTTPGVGGDVDPCDGLTPTITGTDGDDTLWGTFGTDVIFGLGGNDTIYGFWGDDILCGGAGDDTLNGTIGANQIHGGDGDDVIRASWGPDRVTGGAGDDTVFGSLGNDTVDAGAGNDWVDGGFGADVLDGADGIDTVSGGWGVDWCDDAEQSSSCETVTNLGEPDEIDPAARWECDGRPATVVGTVADDWLFGTLGDDVIVALGGDDRVVVSLGNDTVCAGDGDDTVFAGWGAVTVAGEAGNDALHGGFGSDVLDGGDGFDTANGGWGVDSCAAEVASSCENSLSGPVMGAVRVDSVVGEATVVSEVRVLNGDGHLVGIDITSGDTTDATVHVWDPTMAVPQIIAATTSAVVEASVYGRQRELTAGGVAGFDVLGNTFDPTTTAPTWTPYGPDDGRVDVGFGYRGELETIASVHLRARDLNPTLGVFGTPDPLDGVVGSAVLSNPVHFADNSPVNKDDPLGLRPVDGQLGSTVGSAAVGGPIRVVGKTGWPYPPRTAAWAHGDAYERVAAFVGLDPALLRALDQKETEDAIGQILTWLGDPFDGLDGVNPTPWPASPSTLGPLNIGDPFKDSVFDRSSDEILQYYEMNPDLLPLVVFEGEVITPSLESIDALVKNNWHQAAKKLEVSLLIASLGIRKTMEAFEGDYRAGALADGVTPLDVALVSYRYSPASAARFAYEGRIDVGNPPIEEDLEEWRRIAAFLGGEVAD